MNYIIDGHNLIAKIPGLNLGMPDDEERLIKTLNHFGEHHRGKIEVYFDGAPTGQAGWRNFGRLRANFVPLSSTADEAIRKRLARLEGSARNWMVVSSDRSVQAAAHEAHASVMSADEFVLLLQQSSQDRLREEQNQADQHLSQAELDEWLGIFKGKRKP